MPFHSFPFLSLFIAGSCRMRRVAEFPYFRC
ncbi:hypothetical protein ABIE30_003236 [Janthinobacterium lividum]|nr:hypothetical protein JANLI_11930 [Janthinobacterium lividum]STQ97249.1 Uncharacterised protein [Janthinobacterium lividum]